MHRITLPGMLGIALLVLGLVRLLGEVPLLWELEARDNAEAIVYGQAVRLLQHQPLYQPLTSAPYTVAAYMPLYYSLAAAGHALLGLSFLPGRLLSLLASAALAISVAALARRVGPSPATAIAAGLVLTLGFAGPPGPAWLALYRVDALGAALAVGAVTVLAGTGGSASPSYRRAMAAGLLAALALLTKQTLAAATLAGALWLFEQDRRKALLFGAVAVAPTVAAGAALEWLNGAFLQNVVTANINPFDLTSLGQNLFIMAIFQSGPSIAALVYLAVRGRGGRGSPGRLVVYYWCAAAVPLFGLAKVGSWHNYWIEWAVPTAVLASASLDRLPAAGLLSGRLARVLGTSALALSTLLAAFVTSWSVRSAAVAWADQGARAAAVSDVVQCVRAAPGASIAMPMDVSVLAGKPIYVEPAIFTILVDAGVVPSGPVLNAIRNGDVGVVVMDLRPDAPQWQHGAGQPIWHPGVLAALRETMELRSEKAGRSIYTPRGQEPPAECR